jgi:hypothetical protein
MLYIATKIVFVRRDNKLFVNSDEGRKLRTRLSTEFSRELLEDIRKKKLKRRTEREKDDRADKE